MPAAARRGKRDATAAGAEERKVMEGRDRDGEVAKEEDARRWRAASSLRTAGREPEADAGDAEAEAEKGESMWSAAAAPSRSTSISSASMAAGGEIGVGVGTEEAGERREF